MMIDIMAVVAIVPRGGGGMHKKHQRGGEFYKVFMGDFETRSK